RALIDRVAVDGEGATIAGESFGGALSLSFALTHPAHVRALVILNSFPWFRPQSRLRLAIAALRWLPWGAMRLVRRLTAFRMHSRLTHRAERRRFLQETRRTTREGYLGRLRILTRYDVRDRLGRVECPVLFIAADRDHLTPSVEQGRFMQARVSRSTLRILQGHGHICLIAPHVDLEQILREWERQPNASTRGS
ncbi:MAG: alpha/beta fold hydrolase, partial [Gemmatimonadaceae bacterium]